MESGDIVFVDKSILVANLASKYFYFCFELQLGNIGCRTRARRKKQS